MKTTTLTDSSTPHSIILRSWYKVNIIAAHTFKNVECSVKADFFFPKGMGQNKRSLGQKRGVRGEKSQFQEASKQSQSYAHCSKELQ